MTACIARTNAARKAKPAGACVPAPVIPRPSTKQAPMRIAKAGVQRTYNPHTNEAPGRREELRDKAWCAENPRADCVSNSHRESEDHAQHRQQAHAGAASGYVV